MDAHWWKHVTCYNLFVVIGQHRLFSAILIGSLAVCYLLPGFIYIICVPLCLSAGTRISVTLYRNREKLGSYIIKLSTLSSFSLKGTFSDDATGCGVCESLHCSRHKPDIDFANIQPWNKVYLPESVDEALEEFFDLVLKDFIYVWYSDLSDDETFINELRSNLRHMVAMLYCRIEKVDVADLIVYDFINIAIQHLHVHMQEQDKEDEHALLLNYAGQRHIALTSRDHELDYLRLLSCRLLILIMPQDTIKCEMLSDLLVEILSGVIILPLMDIIANPNIINKLLLLFFEDAQKLEVLEEEKSCVLLHNFNKEKWKPSSLPSFFNGLNLKIIQDEQKLLYTFMQFLKCENCINVLECYLELEAINGRLLNPDLLNSDLVQLQTDLRKLYKVHYTTSRDSLNFHPEIMNAIKGYCEGPAHQLSGLQTSTPLFRSQDAAHDLLNVFIVLFVQSSCFFNLKFGERLIVTNLLHHKISEFRTINKMRNASTCSSSSGSISMGEDSLGDTPTLISQASIPHRDLSSWSITVDSVVERMCHEVIKEGGVTTTRRFYVYTVRVNNDEGNWLIERLYSEFYVLEKKLMEFHGSSYFNLPKLPTKQTFGKSGRDYLERRITVFQEYLNSLLDNISLSGSELLFNFLKSSDERFSNSPLLDISKVNVKMALRPFIKEKGQNLDHFLKSFVLSTFMKKGEKKDEGTLLPPTPPQTEPDTMSVSSEKTCSSSLYDNNADTDITESDTSKPGVTVIVRGGYDALIYLAQHVFHCHWWIVCVAKGLGKMLKTAVDMCLCSYLTLKLMKITRPNYSVKLLHIISDAIFFDNDPPETEEIINSRRKLAFNQLQAFIPSMVVSLIGRENNGHGLKVIFNLLQKPKLNKQLSYMLLDCIATKLFPELTN